MPEATLKKLGEQGKDKRAEEEESAVQAIQKKHHVA
jgi:hypothetical protein